ncbi:hypothetical protein [Streptomyces sp. P17]|uniref:hypothetical protein n=1 Tax=Streptomyces sp. P17 TaxID=3074716 RepID=UPI0028F3FC28|nr:hypothetical protein [Streptomyces sp. P17]MDT9696956.1 hypothetical protein [Streptomyces sp. P17]
MPWGLREAVGLTNEGTQCPNHAADQQQVAELLDAVGLPAGGTALDALPPIADGHASNELCEAVRDFQTVQEGLVADARVDVGAGTWNRLMALVDPAGAPVEAATPLLLAVSNYDVFELPENAAPWPSLSYTLRGQVAEWDGPGIHMELWVNGPLKVSWSHEAYTLGCEVSPDFKALEEAVASGSARAIGGVALDQLCSRLRTESQDAIGSLFAAASVSTGLDVRTGKYSGDPLVLAGALSLQARAGVRPTSPSSASSPGANSAGITRTQGQLTHARPACAKPASGSPLPRPVRAGVPGLRQRTPVEVRSTPALGRPVGVSRGGALGPGVHEAGVPNARCGEHVRR